VLSYPLEVGFKIVTIGTRIRVTDATGQQIAYVRKKKFKLKEDVMIYDFSARYVVTGPNGESIGAVGRQGMRSLWKSAYSLVDASGSEIGSIHEENAWVKVLDGLMESIPFGDALGGMFFHPAYLVDVRGETVLRV
jgi:uncharacterized protein YxjI